MDDGQEIGAGSWQGRPVWADVDLDVLAQNVRELKEKAGSAALMAVVKANAYGHGAVAVSRAALAAGAERLGVICVEEGEELRLAGITAPILVMGPMMLAQAERVVDLSLTPTVNSRELALALSGQAVERGVTQRVHLKVETGLNRFGVPPEELLPLADFLRGLSGIEVEGLFTHFASVDEGDKAYTRAQFDAFMEMAERVRWIPTRHVANTATLMDMPALSLDMVRTGIGMYGCYPSSEVSRAVTLRPVLSLRSRVARLKKLSPGETVSYGRTWRAGRPSVIALVACGYGDGLRRALSNRGSVLVRGRRVPIVGRVAMDMCVADVTEVPEVQLGDEVVLIGRQGDEEIPVEELAELCDTINYEILCGVTARVPRVYRRAGQVVAVESLLETASEEEGAQRALGVAEEHA
jgi:alanine racemase